MNKRCASIILGSFLMFCVLLSLGCNGTTVQSNQQPDTNEAPVLSNRQTSEISDTDYAVWSALLGKFHYDFVIAERTENAGLTSSDSRGLAGLLPQFQRTLQANLWNDLLKRQASAVTLQPERFLFSPVRLTNDRNIREGGFVSLTLPGYNAAGTQALVYIYQCSADDGLGQIHYLEKQNGVWVEVTACMVHSSLQVVAPTSASNVR